MNILFCYRQLHAGDEVVFVCVPSSLSGMESVVTDHGIELFQLPDSGLLQDLDTAHVCSYMHKLYCRPIATWPLICVCLITAAILDCFGSCLSNFHDALSDKDSWASSFILELANATTNIPFCHSKQPPVLAETVLSQLHCSLHTSGLNSTSAHCSVTVVVQECQYSTSDRLPNHKALFFI